MSALRHRLVLIASAALAMGSLSACAPDSDEPGEAAASAPTCAVQVTDAWVKTTDTEMTGAFGELTNTSDAQLTIVSATSPVAGKMEIHEVVDREGQAIMRPIEGGLPMEARQTITLGPGRNHLMLMALAEPIEAGQEVQITLTCANGATAAFTGVAKPFLGGEETYEPGMEDMESMDSSPSRQS